MKKFNLLLLAFVILALAFVFRVYNITIVPVFADEAIYIRWSQVMQAVPELRFLPLSDGKQPLFMWIVIPFFKLFSDPLFAGRIVSALCGLDTTIGVGVLTYLLFQSNKSNSKVRNSFALPLLAAFFYAISPFAIFFDRMAMADSMLSAFGIWTFIFALLSVRHQRLDCAMIAGFLLGGALLTKSPALYFVLLLPFTLLFFDFRKENRYVRAIKTFGLWVVTWGIGYGFYNILRLGPNFHMLSSRNLDYVYPLSHIVESPFDPLKPFLMEVVRWFWILGPGVLILLVIGGIVLNLKRYPRQIIFLSIVALAPILASAEFAKVFTARYIFFSLPYVIILGVLGVSALKNKWLMYVAFSLFVFHSLYLDFQLLTNPQKAYLPRSERSGYLEEWTAGYGIKEVDNYIRGELKKEPDKKIVVGTEGYFGTLPDGLQMYLNDMPQITVIGVGQPIREVHNSLKESKEAGNKTYLVVNDSRFLADSEKLGLRLIESYPKAIKPNGTIENLLLFEVR